MNEKKPNADEPPKKGDKKIDLFELPDLPPRVAADEEPLPPPTPDELPSLPPR